MNEGAAINRFTWLIGTLQVDFPKTELLLETELTS